MRTREPKSETASGLVSCLNLAAHGCDILCSGFGPSIVRNSAEKSKANSKEPYRRFESPPVRQLVLYSWSRRHSSSQMAVFPAKWALFVREPKRETGESGERGWVAPIFSEGRVPTSVLLAGLHFPNISARVGIEGPAPCL